MNICVISPFPLYEPPYSYVGAYESWWKPLSKKHTIISISPSISKKKHDPFYPNSKIVDIRIPSLFLPSIPYTIPNPISLLKTIQKINDEYRIHVFHVIKIMFINSFISSLYIKHIIKKPLIVSVHGANDYFQSNWIGIIGKLYKKIFAKITLNQATKIITLDAALLKGLNIKKNISTKTIRICPNEKFFKKYDKEKCRDNLNISKNNFIVIFIGGIRIAKGVQNLHHIALKLTDKYDDIEFFFLGEGPLRKKLSSNKNDKMHFPGYVNNPEIYLAAADVFILPSYSEGLSMAVLEAIAMSKPVIVSNVGANPNIINKDYGILVNPSDMDSIEDSILNLYKNRERINYMSAKTRTFFKKCLNNKNNFTTLLTEYKDTIKSYFNRVNKVEFHI